ncbi:MAG: Mrp/NBP35 family ATP-binding protein, partial [Acidobacteriota bacterium]|nr:Mrp/NBP35 family ATP-binding protein [Acidobacteriota bacterium]
GVPLGTLGMVREVALDGDTARVAIALTVSGCPMKERIARDVAVALGEVDGIANAEVRFAAMSPEQRGALAAQLHDGGQPSETFFDDGNTSVIAIASGKGGVGKSTITVNLACALAAAGYRVGLLDADVWGFSIPRMLGITAEPVGFDGLLFPAQAHGVKVVSMGLFTQPESPVIWRGPLLHRAMRQFLGDVFWGELDVLLCDLPPGTGDVPLSLAAMLPRAQAVIVTTPQEAARTVAQRAGAMATRAQLRVAGVIENMAAFVCPCCGAATPIFGSGGGAQLASALEVPLLAEVPIAVQLRAAGDEGMPLVLSEPESAAAVALTQAAQRLLELAPPPGPQTSTNLAAEGSVSR